MKILVPILIGLLIVVCVGCGGSKEKVAPNTQPKVGAKKSEPPKATPNKLIANPIVEVWIRGDLNKPEGELTKADLEKITILDAGHSNFTDVPKGLEKLTKLESLLLVGNQLTDVKGLEKLTQLEKLYLQYNELTDVKGLENLTQLKELVLNNNKLTDVKGLEKLTQLTFLQLGANQLTKAPKGLEKLTQLTRLDLDDNKLTDVKGLEKLTQLTVLNLQSNELTEVPKGLEKLTNLEELNLTRNPNLTKAQIDELQKALPKCRISHNAK